MKMIDHFVSESTAGWTCRCGTSATHKVEEHIPQGDTGYGEFDDQRHPFTVYVCCRCFGELMGLAAVRWCGQEEDELDIVERLQDNELFMDAMDDAAEEILKMRGILQRFIKACDDENATDLYAVLERAREYMDKDD